MFNLTLIWVQNDREKKNSPEAIVREIKRNTRRKFSSEEKIRIVLEGLRGEDSIATICRREGINPNLYYRWSKAFFEGGMKRLSAFTKISIHSGLQNW